MAQSGYIWYKKLVKSMVYVHFGMLARNFVAKNVISKIVSSCATIVGEHLRVDSA